VAEGDPVVPQDQHPGLLGLLERADGDPELPAGADHRRERAVERRGRHERRLTRLRLERPDTPRERLPQIAAGHRRRSERRQSEALTLAEQPGQLDQRERVAAGRLQQRLDGRRRELAARRLEELRGLVASQAVERQLVREAPLERRRARVGACFREHADARAVEPPCRVADALARGDVEPLRVVDDDEQRLLARRAAQQAEQPFAGGETTAAARGRMLLQGERRSNGTRLRRRQVVEPPEQRCPDLDEPGERKAGLRLDADRGDDAEAAGPLARRLQQRGLPDSGLAGEEQAAAALGPHVTDEPVDGLELPRPPEQHGLTLRVWIRRVRTPGRGRRSLLDRPARGGPSPAGDGPWAGGPTAGPDARARPRP
jgi:hypothetical protein